MSPSVGSMIVEDPSWVHLCACTETTLLMGYFQPVIEHTQLIPARYGTPSEGDFGLSTPHQIDMLCGLQVFLTFIFHKCSPQQISHKEV